MIINRTFFFSRYRTVFGGFRQHQVDGLNTLLSAFEADPRWSDIRHVAYALATTKRETGVSVTVQGQSVLQTYHPIAEKGSQVYLSKYYLNPRLRRALGNIRLSDSWVYKGRGYVQITGRANYTKFASLLDLPLLDRPELALEHATAFEIMTLGMHHGLFTGIKLSDYIYTGPQGEIINYFNARRIINALDHADEIADDAVRFEAILCASKVT